jgi:hypothetical protein
MRRGRVGSGWLDDGDGDGDGDEVAGLDCLGSGPIDFSGTGTPSKPTTAASLGLQSAGIPADRWANGSFSSHRLAFGTHFTEVSADERPR